jgi:rhodanese-related sulfurtransferase
MPSDEHDRLATVDELLATARGEIGRLTPPEALAAMRSGAILVDIRPAEQREREGHIPGARVIARNVLEWRLDPQSEHRDPEVARLDLQVIVICDQGYQSSLAAATLGRFGLDAADVIGGVQSWLEEGLPLEEAAHWRRTYAERKTRELSWTEPTPRVSLELIEEAALPLDAAIVDVGGGASRLAAELVGVGHSDVTVVDVAPEALEQARADLGEGTAGVTWVEADIRSTTSAAASTSGTTAPYSIFSSRHRTARSTWRCSERRCGPGGTWSSRPSAPTARTGAAGSRSPATTPRRSNGRSARPSSLCRLGSLHIERRRAGPSSSCTRICADDRRLPGSPPRAARRYPHGRRPSPLPGRTIR